MTGLCFAAVATAQPFDAGAAVHAASLTPTEIADAGVSKSADEYHTEGVRLLRERRMQSAIVALQRAVALDDKSAVFVTDLGYAYLLNEQLSEAEAAFERGITLDPVRPHAYGHLVECILREPNRWEKRTELLRILEQGIRANSDREARLKIEVARIRAEHGFGLVDRAREHIEDTLRLHPTRSIEKQLLELKSSLAEDEKARALRDWPEPDVPPKSRARFAECDRMSDSASKKDSLACLAELLAQYPAWRAPRRLRVKILAEQGHYDEAVKDLTTLSHLEPSEPTYYRQLGLLLAEHGGLLELERADAALRMALALEPEWTELAEVRKRLASRRSDSVSAPRQVQQPVAGPSENAAKAKPLRFRCSSSRSASRRVT
jgi:Flp pilus assembly protein TadD